MGSKIWENVESRETRSPRGVGLFALKGFKKGEAVYSFDAGRHVAEKEINRFSDEEKNHLDKAGEGSYEIMEPPACHVNHSCTPNIKEKDRVGYALKDIVQDEELMVDYAQVGSAGESFVCHCGTKNCRGMI